MGVRCSTHRHPSRLRLLERGSRASGESVATHLLAPGCRTSRPALLSQRERQRRTPGRRGALGSRKNAIGVSRDGAACKGGPQNWRGQATHAAPRCGAPIGGGYCPADCHFARPLQPLSRFSEPLMSDSLRKKGCDSMCTHNAPAPRHARQREPEGRSPARMRRQAPSEATGRGGTLFTRVRVILRLRGGGGRVGCN